MKILNITAYKNLIMRNGHCWAAFLQINH